MGSHILADEDFQLHSQMINKINSPANCLVFLPETTDGMANHEPLTDLTKANQIVPDLVWKVKWWSHTIIYTGIDDMMWLPWRHTTSNTYIKSSDVAHSL